jgi:hypothetical protein
MLFSVKPVLTEDLCVVQKEEVFNNMMLHKDYYHKISVKKMSLVVDLEGLDAKTK